jgi:signal transduction histidine kinase
MPRPPPNTHSRPPRFLGQALLVLLPVAVLTVIGLLSIRQDRLLAAEEARDRAGRLAQEVADRALTGYSHLDVPAVGTPSPVPEIDTARPRFAVSPEGQLVLPLPLSSVPEPQPLDPAGLDASTLSAWESAWQSVINADPAGRVEAWGQLLASQPPAEFAAIAHFERAQAEVERGDFGRAQAGFQFVATDHADARGETGLPLGPLASWRASQCAIRLVSDPDERSRLIQAACSNLVVHPTLLTPMLLQQIEQLDDGRALGTGPSQVAAVEPWRQLWESTQLARRLFGVAQSVWEQNRLIPGTNNSDAERVPSFALAPIWLDLPATSSPGVPADPAASSTWLLTRFPPQPLWFRAWHEPEVAAILANVCAEVRDLPPYFDVSLTIAGRTVPAPGPHPLLAERGAQSSDPPGTVEPTLVASVRLRDPDALYARQRQRTRWFVAVVLAAAITALVGLGSAHRAFRRQLRLSEMKSNFVSSVSHELRAPIASVRLLAESLERGTVTDDARRQEYFGLIGQECRRLSSLIENVLDFSRIDQQRKQYEFEPTDVLSLVDQGVKVMQPYAAARQVTLQLIQPSAFKHQPHLDGRAIQQALVNLLDNAVKHSPPGSAVAVELASRDHPTPCLMLSVSDQGPGVPPSERDRIFEPFCRLGTELRRETAGIGIGLSIVRHVANAHGGRVWVEGEPGRGSRFVLELPLVHELPLRPTPA